MPLINNLPTSTSNKTANTKTEPSNKNGEASLHQKDDKLSN